MKALGEEAIAAIPASHEQQGGELNLGASQTIGQYLLPTFVAGFLRTNPKVRIAACSGNTNQMLEALVAHKIQIALGNL